MSMKQTLSGKRERRLPHVFLLLFSIILACTVLTWILPAGEFERTVNSAGSTVVVPGTYHAVARTPVGPFQMLQQVYNGMCDAASISFFVFISYACVNIIISSGAFNGLVAFLLRTFRGKARLAVIPIFITLIGAGSSTIGLFSEWFPFIPVFVSISIAMGYDAIVGLAIVALGAGMGYSGSTINPFTVGVAQTIAEVPAMSGVGFRAVCHLCMIAAAALMTMRYAAKIAADPEKSLVYGDDFSSLSMSEESVKDAPFGLREKLVLLILAGGVAAIVWGCGAYHWGFPELSAVFLIMGILSAAVMGSGPNEIAAQFEKGFLQVTTACMMVGLARGILMVLRAGSIIDTVVYGLSVPLSAFPGWLCGVAMLVMQTFLNFLIPSGSGQAATSMPIMAPLADLLGVSRDAAVLAFQFGDGLSNIVWPTGFAIIMSGLAGVKVEKWWKFVVPVFLVLFGVQALLMILAAATGFGV